MSWSRWNCERGGTYPAGASIGRRAAPVGGKVKASGTREAVASLLVPLREHRAALADALQAEPTEPWPSARADATPEPADWHALDAAYLAHHFNCPTCIAAGRDSGYGLRCGTGAALWRAYAEVDPD